MLTLQVFPLELARILTFFTFIVTVDASRIYANTWSDKPETCLQLKQLQQSYSIQADWRLSLEYALIDHPEAYLPAVKEAYLKTKSEAQKLRLTWFLSTVGQINPDEMRTAKDRALALGLSFEYVGLLFLMEEGPGTLTRNPSERMEIFARLIQQARDLNNDEALAFMLSQVSLVFVRNRMLDQALPLIDELIRLNDRDTVQSLLVDYNSKIALATSFMHRKMPKEELEINQVISQQLRGCGVRTALATLTYSRSNLLLNQPNPDLNAIDAAITETLSLAQNVDATAQLGLGYYAKSLAESLKNRYEQAIQDGNKSLVLFQKKKWIPWVAKVYARMAFIASKHQRPQEAVAYAESALENFPEDNQEARQEAYQLLYQSYSQLNQPLKSFKALEQSHKLFQDLASKRQQTDYNKAAAAIGLQLEQEKNRSLQLELTLKAKLLAEAERVKLFALILGLALVFIALLMVYAWRLYRLAEKSRQNIAVILENIDEGLFTLHADFSLGKDHSQHLYKLLPSYQQFQGLSWLHILQEQQLLQSEDISMTQEILSACLGEESLAWELNESNLPQNLRHPQGKVFQIRWIPIFSKQQKVDKFLVSLRDITKESRLEETVGRQEKSLQSLPTILSEILSNPNKRAQQALEELQQTLHSVAAADLKIIHTFKGLFRSFHYKTISQLLHQLETHLKNKEKKASDDTQALLHDRINEYLHLFRSLVSSPAQQTLPALPLQIAQWLLDIRQRAEANGIAIASLSFVDKIQDWQLIESEMLEAFCLHGLNNALDHGYLRPKKKGLSPPPFSLKLSLEQYAHTFQLSLQDRGVGLSFSALRELALSRGYQNLSEEGLAALVFEEDVSTAEQISETSGRGVGLSAIKAKVESLGGEIYIRPNSDSQGGCLMVASWPIKAEMLAADLAKIS